MQRTNRVLAIVAVASGFSIAADDAAYRAHVAESLATVQRTINAGPFRSSWESLESFQAPQWYADGKFGIFIHWGLYSVPAFGNEWYPRNMFNTGSVENQHHIATYGDPSAWPYHFFLQGASNKAGQFTKFQPKLVSAGGNFRSITRW